MTTHESTTRQRLPLLLALVCAAGLRAEARGALAEARVKLAAAEALDGEFSGARSALAGVAAALGARHFRAALSAALTALDRHDFEAARKALARARKLRPDAPEVRDARVRLANAVVLARLRALRVRAEALAGEERWTEAVQAYDAALAIDPNVGFARRGRARSEARARLQAAVDRYLTAPERLSSPAPLADAEALLARAGALSGIGPRLSAKLDRLERRIAAARTPLPVVIESDNQTTVVLYRVGRFGRFRVRKLQLPPGNYTATGSCPGYRDVRVRFEVRAGRPPAPVVVRCEERI